MRYVPELSRDFLYVTGLPQTSFVIVTSREEANTFAPMDRRCLGMDK